MVDTAGKYIQQRIEEQYTSRRAFREVLAHDWETFSLQTGDNAMDERLRNYIRGNVWGTPSMSGKAHYQDTHLQRLALTLLRLGLTPEDDWFTAIEEELEAEAPASYVAGDFQVIYQQIRDDPRWDSG